MLDDSEPTDAPLPTPRRLRAEIPLGVEAARVVEDARRAVGDLVHGRDTRRLLVVVGPCSIHDVSAAWQYGERLARVAERTRQALVVVMRAYFSKPRTVTGWKGLLNDPRLDGSCDVATGLHRVRSLLVGLADLGVAPGAEILDPMVPAWIGDALAWGSVGARTVESQPHREMASGLGAPVGVKNRTDGAVEPAVQALRASREPHSSLTVDLDGRAVVRRAPGNRDVHLMLRGGAAGPNYQEAHLERAAALVRDLGIARPLLIDCSHDNSGKDPTRQSSVCRAVLRRVREGRSEIVGLALESNLEPGRQAWTPRGRHAPGVSITDACIGWPETERLLYEIAECAVARPAAA